MVASHHPAVFAACIAGFIAPVAQAQIRVMAPNWLVQEFAGNRGRIDGSTATFGAPFYGERILGEVVWGDSKGDAHCTDQDYEIAPPEEMPVEGHSYNQVRMINIVMVRRGKCSFVTKVKIAKAKGAHAVIIVDKEDSQLSSKDIQRIIVADDGYGSMIDIPSMLISKQEGKSLIDAVKSSRVVVELVWDIPTNHVVSMDLWMSSGSRESMKFLKEFAPKRKALNELVRFIPHFHVFAMEAGQDFNELCYDSQAQYCAEDPDGAGSVTGKMVLLEDVRQLCIHELTKVSRSELEAIREKKLPMAYAEKWWDYIERFTNECPLEGGHDDEHSFGDKCAERLMHKVGIDTSKVTKCMLETQAEKLKQQRENVAWSPRALRINGWRYSGSVDADLVTRALCAGFVQPPPVCNKLVQPRIHKILQQAPPSAEGVGIGTLLTTLMFVGVIAAGAVLLYKRSLTRSIQTQLREEVMLEVQAQMDSYKQLPS